MAILSSDGSYVTVQYGDTLWGIAAKYLGAGIKYQELAKINNKPNPNILYVGEIVKLKSSSGGSSSKKSTSPAVVISGPGLMSTSKTQLVASWTWSKESQTESYKVVWEYQIENGTWYTGESPTISVDQDYKEGSRYDTYDIPKDAVKVRFKIKPISITKEDGKGNKTVHWDISWSGWKTYTVTSLFEVPSAPSLEIDKDNKLTVSLDGLDINATHIQFEIVRNDTTRDKMPDPIAINNYKSVSYSYTVAEGNEYKARCRANKKNLYSDWSDFSSIEQSMPSKPSGITQCKAADKNTDGYAVYLKWDSVKSATTYDIEYTTKKEYFDNAGDTTTVSTVDASTELTIYKLSGGEYFFRVRAVNSKGSSDWSGIKSVKIGEAPGAPTTWSSTTTAIVGEPLNLYWVHNSEDGSSQSSAQVEIEIAGVKTIYKVENTTDEDEKDKTSVYAVDTSKYTEGTVIKWRVRTAGILLDKPGEWSIERTVDIYAKPTLELMVTNTFEILEDGTIELVKPVGGLMDILTSFPFYVKAVAGPNTQAPIGYHLSIISNEVYETVDQIGLTKIVSAGEQVYSKYFDTSTTLLVEMSADNLDLENGVEYTIVCVVSMNSGLTAEASSTFRVDWVESHYEPNAEVTINEDTLTASIRPFCEEYDTAYYKVSGGSGMYSITSETVDSDTLSSVYTTTGEEVFLGVTSTGTEIYYGVVYVDSYGNPITPVYYRVNVTSDVYTITNNRLNKSLIGKVYTTTGEEVLLGVNESGTSFRYCMVTESAPIEGVTLSVYRREYNGEFTKIASGIDNTANTFITDPHPALDYARYRIIATAKSTGAVSYYDLPAQPVGGKAVIIQWDEDWSSFDNWSEDPLSQPAWSGSLLKLPYNIDVSDNSDPDVTSVKYIGRKRPVTYYGTQYGETSTWNVEIEKSDKETLYALRRLSIWMDDVYVREPSGSGYWANIKVSFSQKHRELTIPVTLNITRVEGGI